MDDFFEDAPNASAHLPQVTYYRLAAADLIDEERVVWLDGDVIVCDDLTPLYNYDLKGKSIGAVHHLPGKSGDEKWPGLLGIPDLSRYVNNGVLLMDLSAFRRNNITPILKEKSYAGMPLHDQGVINSVFYDDMCLLPLKYNFKPKKLQLMNVQEYDKQELDEALCKPVIVHYSSYAKPWRTAETYFTHLWWETVKQTPYKDHINEWLLNKSGNHDHIINKKELEGVLQSTTFKVGKVIMFIPTWLKRMFKGVK